MLSSQPPDAIASNSKDGNRILLQEDLRMQKQQYFTPKLLTPVQTRLIASLLLTPNFFKLPRNFHFYVLEMLHKVHRDVDAHLQR